MSEIPDILFRSFIMVAAIIVFTRLQGLRSFSKLSGFDFSLTVAFGSILAGTIITPSASLWFGASGLAAVFVIQGLLAIARRKWKSVGRVIDNQPLLLMDGETMLEDNMARAQVTREDLMSKLREANVLRFDQVHAVILETTGDVSVLHSGDSADLDAMLEGVDRGCGPAG